MFHASHQPYPVPRVFIAAVGEAMTEIFEVADPATSVTPRRRSRAGRLTEVSVPALPTWPGAIGSRSRCLQSCEVMVATGAVSLELAAPALLPRANRLHGSRRRLTAKSSSSMARSAPGAAPPLQIGEAMGGANATLRCSVRFRGGRSVDTIAGNCPSQSL